MKSGPARFKHQLDGVSHIVKSGSMILADEPGLGKSAVVIDAIDELKPHKVLIVVPNTLKGNWLKEFQIFGKDKDVQTIVGHRLDREKQIKSPTQVSIINYELLRLHTDLLSAQRYDFVAYDEAHRLKNRSSQVFKASRKISKASGQKVFMSGTPLTRSVMDLWALLTQVNPKKYGSFWKFVEQFCDMQYNGFAWTPVDINHPDDPRLVMLREELGDVFLRREMSEVFPDFVGLRIVKRYIDLSPEQWAIYKQLSRDLFAQVGETELFVENQLALLTRLKQVILDPRLTVSRPPELKGAKVDALLELLESLGEDPVVVFTQFASAIQALIATLSSAGISAVEYSGQISQVQCDLNEDRWKSGLVRILVAGIDKGREGHTWTRASHAVFLDKKYLPHENEQARKRIHRISQDRPVTIWELLATGTIDEKIEQILEGREELFHSIITRTMLERLLKV